MYDRCTDVVRRAHANLRGAGGGRAGLVVLDNAVERAPSDGEGARRAPGASAYAPEHTRAAYELALAQGADYVEQDLGVTKDGVLVCLHDDSLERTTNVRDVFPGRSTIVGGTERGCSPTSRWPR
jgi:hypothetical protein